MLRIDLPRELENELTLLAALTGQPVRFHVRQAILEYLDELEDRVAETKWLEEALAAEDEGTDGRAMTRSLSAQGTELRASGETTMNRDHGRD